MEIIVSDNFLKLELILPPEFNSLPKELLNQIKKVMRDDIDKAIEEPSQKNIKIKLIHSVTQEIIEKIIACVDQYEKE